MKWAGVVFLLAFFLKADLFPLKLTKGALREPAAIFSPHVQGDAQALHAIEESIQRRLYHRALEQSQYFLKHFSLSQFSEQVYYLKLLATLKSETHLTETAFKAFQKKYAQSPWFYKACIVMAHHYIDTGKDRKGELLLRKVLSESSQPEILSDAQKILDSLAF